MSDPTNRESAADDDTRPLGDELFDDPVHGTGDPSAEPSATAPADPAPTASVLDTDPGTTSWSAPDPGTTSWSAPDPVATTSLPPAGPTTAAAPGAEPPTRHRGPRISTIVWGFVIIAFGAVVVATAMGARVDTGLAAIVVLAVAGVTLVVGSIVSGARRRRG